MPKKTKFSRLQKYTTFCNKIEEEIDCLERVTFPKVLGPFLLASEQSQIKLILQQAKARLRRDLEEMKEDYRKLETL